MIEEVEVGDIVRLHNGNLIKVHRIEGDYITDKSLLGYHKSGFDLIYKPYKPSLKFRKEEVRRCANKWRIQIKFLDEE